MQFNQLGRLYMDRAHAGGAARTTAPMPKRLPPPSTPQQPGERVIFTLGSPERSESKAKKDGGFGSFLEACALCKKKLQPAKNIYMLGYLGAYCSPDCRDDRIALDGMDTKEVAQVPTTMLLSKRFR